MVSYDPKIIQEFAEGLYKKANSIIASYTLLGLLIGLIIGFAVGEVKTGFYLNSDIRTILTTILAIIGGLIGFSTGMGKAFILKLQAQTALCQMKIEQNTNGKLA